MRFRSKEEARGWCAKVGADMGELLTVGQVWELSKLWYKDRMLETFSGRTVADAHGIFETLCLNAPFWRFE